MAEIIFDWDKLSAALDKVRSADGAKVVFTNGCFDFLHPGHVRSLQEARKLGTCLVVGLNSDASVQNLKGLRRPIYALEARAEILSALACVDFVTSFEEDTPLELIERIAPDVLVKGSDYKEDEIVGADFVKEHGGRVERIPLVAGWSSTQVLEDVVHKFTHPTDEEPTPPFGTQL